MHTTQNVNDNKVDHKCDILLIYPPYFRLLDEYRAWYPLGVGYLASCLNSHGIAARVYNADSELFKSQKIISYKDKFYKSYLVVSNKNKNKFLVFKELENVLKLTKPKIIGMSVLTDAIPVVNEMIKICHDKLPDTPIVIGGPHTNISYDISKDISAYNYAIKGESEQRLHELVGILLGIDNKKIENYLSETNIVNDLDNLPFPNLAHMYSFNIDLKEKFRKTMISTSRGCPFKCTFCYMNRYYSKMRFRNPENVISEIKFNISSYEITKFYFIDDSFGVNKSYLNQLCNQVNQLPIEIKWSCMTHEKIATMDNLEIMKKAGCDSIHLGIESGSERILNLLGKKTNKNLIKKKCKLILEKKLKLKAFFMIGLPTETERDIQESMRLLRDIKPYEAILQIYVPYPNTELYEHVNKNICNLSKCYNWNEFYKARINYQMIDMLPRIFDELLEEFFNLVEDLNEENGVYR